MNKRQAMVEALAMLSGEAEAMSMNNLGMNPKDELKISAALIRLADELQKRCYRINKTLTSNNIHDTVPVTIEKEPSRSNEKVRS